MHEVWVIPMANMTYTRSQNYINMVFSEHEIHPLKIMIVVSICAKANKQLLL